MRYFDAQAYIPFGFPTVRIYVGEEEGQTPGLDLTNSPTGTGVNDPDRTIRFNDGSMVKRPRYGNAYPGDGTPNSPRGNDASQIDVNDNNTTIVRPIQKVCP